MCDTDRSSPARSDLCGGVVAALGLALAAPALGADVTIGLDAGDGLSVRDSTGSVERLRVDEATGNVSRNGALFVHTTGSLNLFVGPGSGSLGATGYGANAAFGVEALAATTSGAFNAAFGLGALRETTSGSGNAAVGAGALASNVLGVGNSALGTYALSQSVTGSYNSAVGLNALANTTTAGDNTAFGARALYANTAPGNAAFGTRALQSNTTGLRVSAFGTDALLSNSTGQENAAFGYEALRDNTSGRFNSAFGTRALTASTTADGNAAFGTDTLTANTTGAFNAAFGSFAMLANTTGTSNAAFGNGAMLDNNGSYNAAFGRGALESNTTGGSNTALGHFALPNKTTGSNNVAIGRLSGVYLTAGSDNIYIANPGLPGDDGRIRIGTVGTHAAANVAGIHGSTSAGGIAVLVNAAGDLGTTTSSARFKRDVRDMGEHSDVLMQLRPVVFRYRDDAPGEPDPAFLQYGLIAEEVADVAPALVATGADGRPYSVRYHVLPALLLNEAQHAARRDRRQHETIALQREQLARLCERVVVLERAFGRSTTPDCAHER